MPIKFEPRYCEENVNVTPTNHFREYFRLSLYLLVIVVGVYMVLGYAAEKIAERLPPRLETAIAETYAFGSDHRKFPKTDMYLQKVLDSLVASTEGLPPFKFRVQVLDQPGVNAAALPAGTIIILKDLLPEFSNENEAAMILAHELGHYAHRDHLRGLGRGLVLVSIMAALGLSGDVPGFIAPSIQTFDLKHSREREAAADRYALDVVVRTYGHAGGAVGAFNALLEHADTRPEIASTHPDMRWRIETLTNYQHQRQYPSGSIRPFPGSDKLPFSEKKEGET